MNKWVKRIGCGAVVLVLVLVIAVAVVGNFILKNKLGAFINAKAIPVAEEKLKVKVGVGGASVNLLGGSVTVSGVKLGNPQGFDEPTLFSLHSFVVDLALKKAFKQQFEVSNFAVRDAEITIIRNKEGLVNVKVLADTLQAGQKPAEEKPAEEKPAEAKPAEEKPAAKPAGGEAPGDKVWAVLKAMHVNTKIRYIDHAMEKPMDLAMNNAMDLRDISTRKAALGRDASISVSGSLAGDTKLCVTDLKGSISPIGAPLKTSMSIAGTIGSIDLAFAKPYLVMAGIGSCDAMSLNVNVVCKDGVFDKASVITFEMKNVQLAPKLAKGGVDRLSVLLVPVSIEGTLAAPKMDFPGALPKAIMESAKANAGDIAAGAASNFIDKKLGGKKDGGKSSPAGGLKKKTPLPF